MKDIRVNSIFSFLRELKALPVLLLGILPSTLIAYAAAAQLAPMATGQIGISVTLAYLLIIGVLWVLFGFRLRPTLVNSVTDASPRLSFVGRNYLCVSIAIAAAIGLSILPAAGSSWRAMAFILLMLAAFMLASSNYGKRPGGTGRPT